MKALYVYTHAPSEKWSPGTTKEGDRQYFLSLYYIPDSILTFLCTNSFDPQNSPAT